MQYTRKSDLRRVGTVLVRLKRAFPVGALLALSSLSTSADLGALPEIGITRLSDRSVTALGQSALTIRPTEWKHSETANFVYHFFQGFIATPVSVEAEFYYRFIAKDLGKDTSQWQRKCHIFIFDKPEDWRAFQSRAHLDPWTGGIHANGELFILRDASFRWKGHTLGHEVAHLVLERFFGAGIPLWLNEGYAEYAGSRAYASFHRARGYGAKPRSQPVAPGDYLALANLTELKSYPADLRQVAAFYDESERLVRFLSAENRTHFAMFIEALGRGNEFQSALWKSYGARFPDVAAIEREFKEYASRDHRTAQSE